MADPGLSIDLCGPGDREEQARLFNACFKKRIDAEALGWRYDQSPHGSSVSLVARPPDEEGVSGYACSPRMALSRGEEGSLAPLGETGDVMTHPDWRKRGIFSRLDVACMAETSRLGWPAVFGLPNWRSANIFLELGWLEVGSLRPWTFLLRAGGGGWATRLGQSRRAGLFFLIDRARCALGRRRRRLSVSGLEVRVLERFPDQVGELSGEVEPGFDLMVRRTAAYLDWRFIQTPSRRHEALGLFDRAGDLAGYVVVQKPSAGSSVGYLVDLLASSERAEAAAIEAGLAHLEGLGAAAVHATAIDDSWWARCLAASGFLPPPRGEHFMVIAHLHSEDHPLAVAARDSRRWYLTDGDRDDETMG